jgi:glyoxylase-like metal-dependent hydrolase (beta-lactamase superfamily II)
VTHWHADHIGGVPGVLKRLQIEKTCQILKGKSDRDTISSTSVSDGHEIQAEGATVKLIHSPGHTDDHFAAFLVEENALFSGDCVLGEGSAVFENLRQLLSSLQMFVNLKPSVIYPGHGPVVENPIAKVQQYIDHRLMREKQVLDALPEDASAGLTIEGIVRKMYTDTPEKLMRAAAGNVFHHLNKLQEEERVMSADNGDTVVYYKVAHLDLNSNSR